MGTKFIILVQTIWMIDERLHDNLDFSLVLLLVHLRKKKSLYLDDFFPLDILCSIPWWLKAEKLKKGGTSHLNQNPQEGLYLETEFVNRQIAEQQQNSSGKKELVCWQPTPTAVKQRQFYRLPNYEKLWVENQEIQI